MTGVSAVDSYFVVVIIGLGPRGLSVLERTSAYLREISVSLRFRFLLVEDGRPGSGRIWRTGQPRWLKMNTVAGELTMFSGRRDGQGCRPGAGCTFLEWAASHPDAAVTGLGPDDYAPRYVYGEYLEHVFDRVCAGMDGTAEAVHVRGRAVAIRRGTGYEVEVVVDQHSTTLAADAVVLATGHPAAAATPDGDGSFLAGDSAADMPLDGIAPGSTVGAIGMGLSFYDVLLSLTVGRGGSFARGHDGRLRYSASGREPQVVAGSRTGLPIRARGVNQKTPTGPSRPLFLTQAALAARRDAAVRRSGAPALDFVRDVGPLLSAEVNCAYLTTLARSHLGDAVAGRMRDELAAAGPDTDRWPTIAAKHGLDDVDLLDLERLGYPFANRRFADPAAFRGELVKALREDLEEALRGNVDSPLKAGLDVIRDVRESLRATIEFGGLIPASHRDFQTRIAPMLSLLSTGPPPICTEQLLALLRAGVVDVVGPGIRSGRDAETGHRYVESPQVANSRRTVSTLLSCRLPEPGLRHRYDPLTRQVLADGIVTEFVNGDHRTGGLRISPGENRVLSADGSILSRFYAVGIPTENVRWFTQIGNGRPNSVTSFQREADAIALSLVRDASRIPPPRRTS